MGEDSVGASAGIKVAVTTRASPLALQRRLLELQLWRRWRGRGSVVEEVSVRHKGPCRLPPTLNLLRVCLGRSMVGE